MAKIHPEVSASFAQGSPKRPAWRTAAGVLGICLAAPFFVWAFLGSVGAVPTMVDVFGIPGLRIPTSITIAGLLIAALAFYEE